MKYNKYRKLVLPAGVALFMIVGSVFLANFLYTRITQILAETAQQDTKNNILEGRLATLQALSEDIKEGANAVTFAIPDKNPSVLILNQLKSLAGDNNILLENISISSQPLAEETGLVSYTISFEAQASSTQILIDFVDGLSSVTPIINISTLEIKSGLASDVTATLGLMAYSAPFPEQLPALEEPLVGLSPEEQSVLDTIQTFTRPEVFTSGDPATQVVPRENPFFLEF